ncbi:MAG: cytochrome c peroxidase [Bacteroidota bacterium]
MKQLLLYIMACISAIIIFIGCAKDNDLKTEEGLTPYELVIPPGLPPMVIPADNPMTVEGVALGKQLFYDPILSGDNTQSCGSCHKANFSFSDSTIQFSIGIDKLPGTRNAMPIVNLGYQKQFFWDGGAANLESQVIGPIQNPVEMHESLTNALSELNAHADYPALFKKVFGGDKITTPMVMKAIAQFERTLISGNSKYDRVKQGLASFTPQEQRGLQWYTDINKGDCGHCHVIGSTFSDFEYRNTGLDSIPVDKGRSLITLNNNDDGKFKTPSLRNIALTAPYMHDGRFKTLEECIQHYNIGFKYAENIDPNLGNSQKGRMNPMDVQDIIAFLNTLTDFEFVNNPKFRE